MILQIIVSLLCVEMDHQWDNPAPCTILSKWQDSPTNGPPKVKRQVVLNLDTKVEIVTAKCIDDQLFRYCAIWIVLSPRCR